MDKERQVAKRVADVNLRIARLALEADPASIRIFTKQGIENGGLRQLADLLWKGVPEGVSESVIKNEIRAANDRLDSIPLPAYGEISEMLAPSRSAQFIVAPVCEKYKSGEQTYTIPPLTASETLASMPELAQLMTRYRKAFKHDTKRLDRDVSEMPDYHVFDKSGSGSPSTLGFNPLFKGLYACLPYSMYGLNCSKKPSPQMLDLAQDALAAALWVDPNNTPAMRLYANVLESKGCSKSAQRYQSRADRIEQRVN